MEVLVFKTSVQSYENVDRLKPHLDALAGQGKWNFALDDCDRILRIVSSVSPNEAVGILAEQGFSCLELD